MNDAPGLHERREESSTRSTWRPASCTRRGDVDDPHHDGAQRGRSLSCRRSRRASSMVRAHRVPTPDVSLVDLTFTPKRDTTRRGSQRAPQGRRRTVGPARRACSIIPTSRSFRSTSTHTPASLDGRQPRNRGARRQAGARRQLVRQRMGLLEPYGRYRWRHRQADLSGWARSPGIARHDRPKGAMEVRDSAVDRARRRCARRLSRCVEARP